MKTVSIRLYCTCGDSLQASATPALPESVQRAWKLIHSGPGHAPCDAKTAAKARRKQDADQQRAGASPAGSHL